MMPIPTSTYRLQFGPSFGFKDAEALVPYLHALGVGNIYASPIFKANAGSTHGYDVTDPNALNPELGSPEEFSALMAKRGEYRIGWLQDIVPNHMAYSNDNQMLMDVFRNGRESAYADFFDIAWDHPDDSLRGKILAPFLGKPYAQVLHDGEIRLERSESGLYVRYCDIRFPLALSSYDRNDIRAHVLPLDRLFEKQFFKLCFWKRASESINYRRFFYLNGYIGLRAEKPEVFTELHKLVNEFVHRGIFTGLRIDHVDGLYDPGQYLTRLRRLAADKYIVVEKILDLDESLPAQWPVQGTTGYDFCNYVTGIFIRTDSEQAFTELYRDFIDYSRHYDKLLIEKKRAICKKYMAGDVDTLVRLLRIAAQDSSPLCEETPQNVKDALVEIIVALGVYRTYINDEHYRTEDKVYLGKAIDSAKRNEPALAEVIHLVGQFLLLDSTAATDPSMKAECLNFIMKFQQCTGPVMAKGFEDTLLYSYNRLVSLNEVGANPDRFGILLDEFHTFNAAKAACWPNGLNATSTHDTKRGEDVRARINVLTEIPELWSAKVRHWKQINAEFKSECHGIIAPDPNDEYLLYQTLIGAMPFDSKEHSDFKQRIKHYITKVVREAKEHSSWVQPNQPYERALHRFVDRILDPAGSKEFWSDFLSFQKQIAAYAIFNSLSQTLLKMTSPGVPDFYQGSELWDLSLVDPDNRRPVDFDKRRKLLAEIRTSPDKRQKTKDGRISNKRSPTSDVISELIESREDGRIKLFLITQGLNVRRRRAELFEKGDYRPLKVRGKYRNHVIGFLRSFRDQHAATIAPRFFASLIDSDELPLGRDIWQDTDILWPASLKGQWRNGITAESVQVETRMPVGKLLTQFPVALLLRP